MATNVLTKNEVEKDTSQSKGMTFAYLGLVAFLFVYCARPNDWTGLVFFPFAKITAGLALLGLLAALFTGGRKFLHFPREVILLFFLFGQLCLSVPFAIWPGGSFETVFTEFSKVIPIVILIVATATTLGRLRLLIMVQSASVGFMALLTVLGLSAQVNLSKNSDIVRSGGAVGGIYGNPNDFAWALALMFPLALALMMSSRKLLLKCFWVSAMIIMSIAVMKTYSRGGTICLVVSGGMSMWIFGFKGRKIHLVIVAAAASLLLLVFAAPDGFLQRIASTTDWAQDDTGSAWARKYLFILSVRTTMEHPLFGIGPGNFPIASGSWHGTHNTFTQFSSEAGIPALVLFCAILWCSLSNLSKLRKCIIPSDDRWILSAGLTASFAGFIVGSFFGMAAYQFFPYFMVGYSCALYRLALGTKNEGELNRPALIRSNISRRWTRHRESESAEASSFSRQLRQNWRNSAGPLPDRTRSEG